MIYDFTKKLLNGDGSVAKDGDREASFAVGAKNALLAENPQLTPVQKVSRYELFLKIKAGPEDKIDLTVDEVSTIKQAVEVFPTLIYGQFVHFLNQKQ